MSPNKTNRNVERQVELRKQGVDEDQAARIAGTQRDHAPGSKPAPDAEKWASKNQKKKPGEKSAKP